MTNEIYRSWLSDRGLDSPGSQPFVLLGSEIHPLSRSLILASLRPGDVTQNLSSVKRLAEALSTNDSSVSWITISSESPQPEWTVIGSILPRLSKVVTLSEIVSSEPVRKDSVMAAGRSIDVFRGPSMEQMSTSAELKRSFWNEVREWLLN